MGDDWVDTEVIHMALHGRSQLIGAYFITRQSLQHYAQLLICHLRSNWPERVQLVGCYEIQIFYRKSKLEQLVGSRLDQKIFEIEY